MFHFRINDEMTKYKSILPAFLIAGVLLASAAQAEDRPNILLCISDDQSYEHTFANGCEAVDTPAFDRISREGIRFANAFCDAPSCGPSRSAILTGQPIWRLKEAGNIHSTLPAEFETYPELLSQAGYFVGATGKAWSPGRLEPGGRTQNPAGRLYEDRTRKPPFREMSNKDYAGNFADFLDAKPAGKPFCFWLGTHESHRSFQEGVGKQQGKKTSDVRVPAYLPDNEIIRSDLLDYLIEVEDFDSVVENAISLLEQSGQLENTIVVVTSDHGMPFPRAKASLYDAGTRVPLAIRWPNGIRGSHRISQAFVNLSDLAATFLEAAGVKTPRAMTSRSLMPLLTSDDPDAEASRLNRAFIAMERHDGCRQGGKGFPCRAIRKDGWLYIKNSTPGRWPAGDPDASVCARAIPFGEVDSSPTKQFLMDHSSDPKVLPFFELAFAKRPAEELYQLENDADQIENLAEKASFQAKRQELASELNAFLTETGDPRVTGDPALWDFYPYYGLRRNKNWKVDSMPLR